MRDMQDRKVWKVWG